MIKLKSVGEGRLQFAATSPDTSYYNIPKNLSILNSRNEEVTDREGNLYGYWCKISTVTTAASADSLVLTWVPNSWKVRNSFRKFHFARDHMFRQAGITKKEMGTYGRVLRPYLSQDHQTSGDQICSVRNVDTNAGVIANGGEWTYTTLGSAPTFEDGDEVKDIDLAMVDKWTLTVLGGNRIQKTSGTGSGIKMWTSVGMVQAYNSDRMEMVPDATADTSVLSPNNPLAALRAQNVVSGEVIDIAEDQQLEAPPYDVTDTGDSIRGVFDLNIMPVSGGTASIRNWGLYFFPAGLISLTNTVTGTNILEIEVLGKELCKDVA